MALRSPAVPERVPRWLRIAVAVVVAFIVGWLLATDSGDEPSRTEATAASELIEPGPVSQPDPSIDDGRVDVGPAIGVSGLPGGFTDDLPVEALDVLETVAQGGPHPYRQDGATFFNREGLLPPEDEGYYREFTVETPGSSDRGARRLVVGDRGEVFYTDDHYGSFVEVVDADV